MRYDRMPLYPAPMDRCDTEKCFRMPLFRDCGCAMPGDECACSRTVRMENPCCPGENADVTLSVDRCGNLMICVHRERPDCRCCSCSRKKHNCW